MKKYQYFLEYVHKVIKTIHPVISNGIQAPNHVNEGSFSETQELIKKIILEDTPVFMGRFGSIELNAFANYLQVSGKMRDTLKYNFLKYIFDCCYPNWFSIGTKNGMCNNAGFFPPTDENLFKWGQLVENDILDLDYLLTWRSEEAYINSYLKNKTRICNSEIYNPFFYQNPWSQALHGKKVLVISPFSETIEEQYKKREFIFNNKNVLPEFELKTIKAFNVLRGINNYKNISNWFDAIDNMEDQISKTDFDIALLGCGAYAFNLGAFVKRMGKKSITLCGSLQTLFGIYGTRYEKTFKERNLLNDFWVRPNSNEKPAGAEFVENGAYW